MKEGYIKFNCRWIRDEAPEPDLVSEINVYRTKLFRAGLIGMYPNGIGFGNISTRFDGKRFVISGTQTGGIEILDNTHYTTVGDFDLATNNVLCRGQVKASSESLTHAVIYQNVAEANAVIHVHSLQLWKKLLFKVPTTSADVEYGTPEMAAEVIRLINSSDLGRIKIFAMAGHEEGVVAFGKDVAEAFEILNYEL
jgi:ribulose-5-phosphate 4-epimerase/fuculose-1-phosphate aldolase